MSQGKANTVLVLICPEDIIKMREGTPPADLRETHQQAIQNIENLLEMQIRIWRPVMAARAPS